MLFSYSRADGSVLRYDIRGVGRARPRPARRRQATVDARHHRGGRHWAVVDTDDGDVWLRGRMPHLSADRRAPSWWASPIPTGRTSTWPTRRRSCASPSTARASASSPARAPTSLGHAGAADRARRRGLRRMARAGQRRRRAVELARRPVRARLRQRGARRPAPPGVRGERRRRHPERDALAAGHGPCRTGAGRLEPELVAR